MAKFFNAGIDTVGDYQFPSFGCPDFYDLHLELIGNGANFLRLRRRNEDAGRCFMKQLYFRTFGGRQGDAGADAAEARFGEGDGEATVG